MADHIIERQVSDMHANAAITHEPATHSHLSRSQSISEAAPPAIPEAAATDSADAPKVEEP